MLKKDDLCRVVAPYAEPGRGAFVVVVRPAKNIEVFEDREYQISGMYGVGYVVSGWVRDEEGEVCGPELVIGSYCLQKVDPGDGEDEINRIAGRPAEDLLKVCDRLIQEFNRIVEQAERLK